ncbi:IS110 family transposase, partial [Gordonia tangerina]
ANSKARRNAAGTSPITRQSGRSRIVSARYIHNDRLVDALMAQAHGAFMHDDGARTYYRKQRARDVDHNAALRQLANRLVGILHGCLARGIPYDPDTAWKDQTPAAA